MYKRQAEALKGYSVHPAHVALSKSFRELPCSGFVTAFLQTRLGVESIMAGIIVNTRCV